jgi:hypothetical protein
MNGIFIDIVPALKYFYRMELDCVAENTLHIARDSLLHIQARATPDQLRGENIIRP